MVMQHWASAGTKSGRWRLGEPGPSGAPSVACCVMWCVWVCVLTNVKQLQCVSDILKEICSKGLRGDLWECWIKDVKNCSVYLWCLIQGGHTNQSKILTVFIIHTWLLINESVMRFECVFVCPYACTSVLLGDRSSISSIWGSIKGSVRCGCALSTSRRHPS